MESHRSYNSSYSEDAHAGGPGDGTSIAHTIHNTKKKFRLPNRYRGFSTSISSLFLDESIVCGALSCCGVILSSRTEHLLNERNIKRGVTRRGGGYGKEGAQRAPSKILGISWIVTIKASSQKHGFAGIRKLRDYREHVFDPALRSQFNDEEYTPGTHEQQQHQRHLDYDDDYYNSEQDIASLSRMVIILIFLFVLGVIGRRRRMRTRFTIQRARTADDHIYYASLQPAGVSASFGTKSVDDSTFHEQEENMDGACSHTICGCYPVDSKEANYADFGDDEDDNQNDQSTVGTGDNNGSSNVKRKKKKRKGGDFHCASAGVKPSPSVHSPKRLGDPSPRPPSMQRVDLITHQPFHEYARDVNNVRRRFMEHATSWFTWGDALVLIATFTQSFLVLMVVFDNNFIFWFVGELIGAYFVAALVEELCKYYGFRFVEHPDLIFLTGLDRSAEQAKTAGGVNAYKFDSQLEADIENISVTRSRSRIGSARSRLREDEEYDEPELRTVRQQAAAITTGMISVAVGLACAENFMYVFFLGGSRGNSGAIWQELMILLFRSVFPVHALAAAMQSINMIKKFVEEPQNHIGVGRIILPAVLLHGTFDAILCPSRHTLKRSMTSFMQMEERCRRSTIQCRGGEYSRVDFHPRLMDSALYGS
ncbi:hypothetical protein QTG54_002158 [Skeletonema marinoi]|uniref:Transmembrane protein n=1 Tax=Skeletonema marinoi TaxID=267567 RepID=A0AAD8YHT1_9STRA|nr:hypothetical protein QTG54_002158 [Skeletonema marinoi]